MARRNLVLQIMLDSGVIDRPEWQRARKRARRPARHASDERIRAGSISRKQVRQELVERFGWEQVYQGGLRVYSTIDMDLQDAAEAAVAQSLKALDEKREALARKSRRTPNDPAPLQAALIAMDPRTGHVRAMVGGRDFDESRFNRAVQARRQPGSAFKPFVYAAALEAGYTPGDDPRPPERRDGDAAGQLGAGRRTLDGRVHEPAHGAQDIEQPRRRASAAAGRHPADGGVRQSHGHRRRAQRPSLALGSGEVTLQSLTAAYGAFANHGMVSQPILIRRVEDTAGQVLLHRRALVRLARSATARRT